jgi:RsiW-degrading membrane proteinase PrsW (M82 family)
MTANLAPAPAAAAAVPPTTPGDWTEQGSLVQPRQAAFWLFIVLMVVGGIGFVEEQLLFVDMSMTAWLIGLVLLALYAVPVYLLVNALDLFEREPKSLLLGAFLWGAVVATFLAARINGEWDDIIQKVFGAAFAREWADAIVAPGVEEIVKFLGVVVIYLIARHEFDDVLDGFVYGALVGLGFTVAEDMYYFFARFIGPAGGADLGPLLQGYFLRVIVGGPYSHVLLTGLTGMGLAYYVTRPDLTKQRRLLLAVGLYIAGVLAHFIWNSNLFEGILGRDPSPVQWFVWAAVKGLPFLILLALVVRLAQRRAHGWVRGTLRDDVEAGLVTDEELDSLGDLRRRRAARKAVARRKGPAGERVMARLQHAQVSLAVAETGTGADREERVAAARAQVGELRGQLDALPDVAAAATAPVAGAGAAVMPAAVPAAAPPFVPDVRVPPEGMPAWVAPDPATPSVALAGTLELLVVRRLQDWAEVRAVNGWSGWVDGRRLVAIAPAVAAPSVPPTG